MIEAFPDGKDALDYRCAIDRDSVCHCIQAEVRKLRIDRPSELLLVMDDYRLADRDGLGYMGKVGSAGVLQTDWRAVESGGKAVQTRRAPAAAMESW
jgi:hypothetical protein